MNDPSQSSINVDMFRNPDKTPRYQYNNEGHKNGRKFFIMMFFVRGGHNAQLNFF